MTYPDILFRKRMSIETSRIPSLLEEIFTLHADPAKAVMMKKYMKNRFPFFGIQAPLLRELMRPIFRNVRPGRRELIGVVDELWSRDHREYQYAAMELADRFQHLLTDGDVSFLERLITTRSWWDTVDFLASRLTGKYLQRFPDLVQVVNKKWMESGNLWLQRTCLLFQLKYKEKTNTGLLFANITACAASGEFFLQKAIGWALREYSKTEPETVRKFVATQKLSPLSEREAMKIIRKANP
ncbi:MAG TPA: DNA alkylation repair protein [Bacteroidetes bacterium]|nr:DNA alkylation repair protein [Bacteroidota bacterium]